MADDDKEKARKKAFYTKQRVTAEEQADEGDTRAQATVAKINKKLGRPDREYTDTEAVNKEVLADVAPDAGELVGGKYAMKLGGKLLGKFLSKGGKTAAKAGEDVAKGAKKVSRSEKGEHLATKPDNYDRSPMKDAKSARPSARKEAGTGTKRSTDPRIQENEKKLAAKSKAGKGTVEKPVRKASGKRKVTASAEKGRVDRISDANKPGQKINQGKKVVAKGDKAPDFVKSRKGKNISQADKDRIDKQSREVPPKEAEKPAETPAAKPKKAAAPKKTKPLKEEKPPIMQNGVNIRRSANAPRPKSAITGKVSPKAGSIKKNTWNKEVGNKNYDGEKATLTKAKSGLSPKMQAMRDKMKADLKKRKKK
jgi:hypothetical protein